MRAQRKLELSRGDRAVVDRIAFATRQRVRQLLRAMWQNEDATKYRFAQEVLAGRYTWLERGAMPLGYDERDLVPPNMDEILKRPPHVPADAHPHFSAHSFARGGS
jgi:hypothetical protein